MEAIAEGRSAKYFCFFILPVSAGVGLQFQPEALSGTKLKGAFVRAGDVIQPILVVAPVAAGLPKEKAGHSQTLCSAQSSLAEDRWAECRSSRRPLLLHRLSRPRSSRFPASYVRIVLSSCHRQRSCKRTGWSFMQMKSTLPVRKALLLSSQKTCAERLHQIVTRLYLRKTASAIPTRTILTFPFFADRALVGFATRSFGRTLLAVVAAHSCATSSVWIGIRLCASPRLDRTVIGEKVCCWLVRNGLRNQTVLAGWYHVLGIKWHKGGLATWTKRSTWT